MEEYIPLLPKVCEKICKQHPRKTEIFYYVREEHGRISPKISRVKNKHWGPSGYLYQKKKKTRNKTWSYFFGTFRTFLEKKFSYLEYTCKLHIRRTEWGIFSFLVVWSMRRIRDFQNTLRASYLNEVWTVFNKPAFQALSSLSNTFI